MNKKRLAALDAAKSDALASLDDYKTPPFKESKHLPEVRCKNCNKLLGHIDGYYEIKCPRCKVINAKKPINLAEYMASKEGQEKLLVKL